MTGVLSGTRKATVEERKDGLPVGAVPTVVHLVDPAEF